MLTYVWDRKREIERLPPSVSKTWSTSSPAPGIDKCNAPPHLLTVVGRAALDVLKDAGVAPSVTEAAKENCLSLHGLCPSHSQVMARLLLAPSCAAGASITTLEDYKRNSSSFCVQVGKRACTGFLGL